MASAKATTDHDEIRRWVEARGGYPAHVKRTGDDGNPGVLRIDYPGFSGQKTLERIDWDTWFEWFDRDNLAFLYQNTARSRFSKLVDRGSVKTSTTRRPTAAKKTTTARKRAATTSAAKKSTTKTAEKRTAAKRPTTPRATAKRTTASRSTTKKSAPPKKATTSRATTSTRTTTSSASAKRTTNHNVIKRWVESRGGWPACVKRTGRGKDPGVLRIDYPGFSGTKTLQRMEWDEWFDWFDRDKLAFLYQDKPRSKFSKLVTR